MRPAVLLTSVLMLLPLSAAAQQALHTIYVSGQASILARPDVALLDIGVVSLAPSASEALQDDTRKMAKVVAAVRSLAVGDDDVRTSQFNIGPMHPRLSNGQEDYNVVSDYQVTNKVTVRVRDIAKLADIIDAAVRAGANASNSVDFDVKDRARYFDQAQAAAVRDARHRADVMAAAEHATVGKMISMTSMPTGYGGGGLMQSAPLSISTFSGGTPILPGVIAISATAYVTYSIR